MDNADAVNLPRMSFVILDRRSSIDGLTLSNLPYL
jgi:hypothetical protein